MMNLEIKAIQRSLGLEPTGAVTRTLDALIRKFQAQNGLKPDGLVGPKTWAALRGFPYEVSDALTHWGVRARPVSLIVLHHSGGYTRAGMERTLNAKKCATNALVMQTGQIVIYGNPFINVASHAKVANAWSLGIDFEHASGEDWPDVQIRAGGRLIAAWCQEHGLEPKINPAPPWDGTDSHPCRTKGKYTDSGDVVEYPRPKLDARYGVGLHRQYGATICPDDLPLEQLQTAIDCAIYL